MFKTRFVSGAALVLIWGSALYFGGYYLLALLFFISMVGLWEFFRALHFGAIKNYIPNSVEKTAFICALIYYVLLVLSPDDTHLFAAIALSVPLCMVAYVLSFPKLKAVEAMCAVFGLLYIPVMLGSIYLLRLERDGFYKTLLIFISSWICDTCAYMVGRSFGSHRLAPVLSPKKSVEGAVGGTLGSAICGAAFGVLTGYGVPRCALLCALGAIISQFGDLFASAVKRNHEIKDYGSLIPGHGGVLDRFDSVIVTAPIIYILSRNLLK